MIKNTQNTGAMTNVIKTGSIVKLNDKKGYYRVTSLRNNKVNLGSVFGKTIYHKGIDVTQVTECENEWYNAWRQTDAYMCM